MSVLYVTSRFSLVSVCRAEGQSGAFRCAGGGGGDARGPEIDSLGKTGLAPSGRPAGVASRALGGGRGRRDGSGVRCRPCEFTLITLLNSVVELLIKTKI